MANRVLQAKARKRMLQIRRLPRRMPGEVSGELTEHSGTPIPARLKAEGVRAPMAPIKDILQIYKNSANSLKTDMGQANEDCLRIYGRLFIGTPPGRKEVLDHLARLRAVSPELQSFTILDNRVQRARVFYNPTKTKFIISYENYKEGVIRTSMAYQYREHLIDDFRRDRLTWVEIRSSG
jgi:hypothetical protein